MKAQEHQNTAARRVPIDAWLAACIAFALVVLNVIRAIRVPITYDEAPNPPDFPFTYSNFIHLTPAASANTHILNSILRKFFTDVFGDTVFALRLDNVLAHIVFLIFSWRLVKNITANRWWALGAFLILNLNPFLFEFWGLSRGYGLAIAFTIVSICCLVVYLQRERTKQLAGCLLFAITAVYSNFALLNYFVAIVGVLSFHGLFIRGNGKRFLRKDLPGVLLSAAALYLMVADPIRKLIAGNQLYYGGDKGVISDTLYSLLKECMFLGDRNSTLVWWATYILTAFIVIATLWQTVLFFRKGSSKDMKTPLMFCLLLLIPLVSEELQHALFGTKFLIDRTALFLYPLLALLIIASLHYFRKTIAATVVFSIVVLLSVYNFAANTSTDRSRLWWTDNYNKVVLDRILANRATDHKTRLRANWVFTPSLNYYVYTKYRDKLEPLEQQAGPPQVTDTMYDYMYLSNNDISSLPPNYRIDTSFIGGGFLLYKKVK